MSPLGYPPLAPPPPPKGSGKKVLLIVLACVLGVGVVFCGCVASILLPSLNRAREMANRVHCAGNLRQIGQGILMYANENRGQFPDTLDRVMATQDLTADVFVCPSSQDTPAPGATAQAQAQGLSKGGHLSYVYVGKGMTSRILSSPNAGRTVVAYEPMTNHRNDGTNVLFADGHVEFLPAAQAKSVIAAAGAGGSQQGGGGE
jgi:prepilin-type processing-associated H-X9-DG protein